MLLYDNFFNYVCMLSIQGLSLQQEKLQKQAQKAEAAELKKLQKEQQKWENGKFALKSIVAEIDAKVVEIGAIGGTSTVYDFSSWLYTLDVQLNLFDGLDMLLRYWLLSRTYSYKASRERSQLSCNFQSH